MRAVKTFLAAATTGVMLVGCGQLPGPYLTCEDVPTAECEAAHDEAVTNGLFLDDSEQVLGAVVRPTEYRLCDFANDPLFDVSFRLRDRSEPLVVTVGETAAGSLAVCTY